VRRFCCQLAGGTVPTTKASLPHLEKWPPTSHITHNQLSQTPIPLDFSGRGKRHVLLEQFHASLFGVPSFDWPSFFPPIFPIFLTLRNEKLLAWQSDYVTGKKLYVSGYLSAAACYRNMQFTRFNSAAKRGFPGTPKGDWPPVYHVHTLKTL